MAKRLSEWEKLGGEQLQRIPKVSEAMLKPPAKSLDDRIDELLTDIPPLPKAEFVPPAGVKLGKTALEKARKQWEEEQHQASLNRALGREATAQSQVAESKEERRKRIENMLKGEFPSLEGVEIEPIDTSDEQVLETKFHDCEELLRDFENLGLGLPQVN